VDNLADGWSHRHTYLLAELEQVGALEGLEAEVVEVEVLVVHDAPVQHVLVLLHQLVHLLGEGSTSDVRMMGKWVDGQADR
jgi:hypothetical protein